MVPNIGTNYVFPQWLPFPKKVAAVLAALVFALPNLAWDTTQHCEFFSGKMALTLAEMGVPCLEYIISQPCSPRGLDIMIDD